jgi:hypothetical protein
VRGRVSEGIVGREVCVSGISLVAMGGVVWEKAIHADGVYPVFARLCTYGNTTLPPGILYPLDS